MWILTSQADTILALIASQYPPPALRRSFFLGLRSSFSRRVLVLPYYWMDLASAGKIVIKCFLEPWVLLKSVPY